MEKMFSLRSVCRSICFRSRRVAAASTNHHHIPLRHQCYIPLPTFFNLPSSQDSRYPNRLSQGFTSCVAHMPDIKDPQLQNVFKDLMAVNWNELPDAVIHDAKEALSKNTDDKAGKDVVTNVFRAAEAVEEFGGMLVSLKMEIDDSVGLSGEDVKPLPDHMKNALRTIFNRYTTYLNSFGPDESYLRKKVETELGTKMIHLKMRCSGLDSEWGKVTVLGTSGLAGSYVEQRA